jgi:peroxiredoxin
MKRLLFLASMLLSASLLGAPANFMTLEPGAQAPDFNLPGVDGRNHTLAEYAEAKILAVLFTCNHCPSAQGAESRVKKIVQDYKDQSFQLVAISPNSAEAVRLNELGYSVYGDSLADMKKHAKAEGFTFPYLYDGETQSVSQAYGVVATPHLFIFDQGRTLRYVGRIDDSKFGDPATIKKHDAREAIDALLAGKPVQTPKTRAHGCSTKWKSKIAANLKFNKEFNAKPVTMKTIDAAGLKKLVQNDTDKLRLINLWATWCAPCVSEMPALVKIGRQFETRGFDMITVSTDSPDKINAAQKMLKRLHAALPKLTEMSVKDEGRTTNNYLFDGDTDTLADALDPKWQGPIPHTVLIAPGGKILFRKSGEIDADELRRTIVKELGRWYSPK